ncbi:MAG: isoleucine--tRNA ligase [archaeon]
MAEEYTSAKEKEIQKYWKDNNVIEDVRAKKANKNYYFIDGPPYASGSIHIGHVLNRSLKDIIMRYKRMKGYYVLDIPGFDTHGVPIEQKVQQKYSLKTKDDIENFGVEKFILECKKFATEHIDEMSLAFNDLGQWMDWKNPYVTLDNKYMETEWWAFKQASDKGLLYKGKYPIHVCPSCETAVSFNEIEHEDLEDNSIYVKLKSKDDPNTYFVVWTTTPWTLPANLAIMVNPKFTYVELINGKEKLIVAKDLAENLIKDLDLGDCSYGKEFLGEKLEGKKYEPILAEWLNISDEIINKSYKVVLSARFVTIDSGTGLVHCAPGHGREDYSVGLDNKLPIYCPVTISGEYDETVVPYKGMKVKELDRGIIEYLEAKGVLLGRKHIKHAYPTCWRCHSPLLQVALPQWFLKIEPMSERLKQLNQESVNWYPSWAKIRFDDWLNNLSDWPISRERYWGCPIPLWVCDKCDSRDVFDSLKSLKEKVPSLNLDMDMHKPYIDEITYKCECGGTKKRINGIFDVWFDSAVASFACLKYPQDKKLFEKFWPAEINIEGVDQIRGWWNSQLIASAICFDKAPFKYIALHGLVLDIDKRKLSKSKGNARSVPEMIEQYSRDYYRYYFAKAYDGMDMLMDEKKFLDIKRIFNLLENVFNFLELYDEKLSFTTKLNSSNLDYEDKWILSRFNSLLKNCYNYYETCEFSKVILETEKFILEELSRIYIKLLRKKENKNCVLNYIYSGLLLLLSPVIPHFTESLYLRYKSKDSKSVHLEGLIEVDNKLIDLNLENNFLTVLDIVQSTLALREENTKRLRWIMPKLVIKTKETVIGLDSLIPVISNMANISKIEITQNSPKGNYTVKKFSENLEVYLDLDIPESYKDIWELSEATRLIQAGRKDKKFSPSQKVNLKISCDKIEFLKTNKAKIENATNTNLEIVEFKKDESTIKLIEREINFSF